MVSNDINNPPTKTRYPNIHRDIDVGFEAQTLISKYRHFEYKTIDNLHSIIKTDIVNLKEERCLVMSYLDKINLAGYVINKHDEEYGCTISPLKLQKTMYLLFAMWGGNIYNINQDINNEEKIEYSEKLNEYLFLADFEAWKYGPVDREIYYKFKANEINPITELNYDGECTQKPLLESFINTIIDQAFKINDFALVDLTHEDKVWKDAYNNGNKKMDSMDIIKEYSTKLE